MLSLLRARPLKEHTKIGRTLARILGARKTSGCASAKEGAFHNAAQISIDWGVRHHPNDRSSLLFNSAIVAKWENRPPDLTAAGSILGGSRNYYISRPNNGLDGLEVCAAL